MLDKNGIEIKTGDIVRITGAYFKTDNALYFVEHSDGDPDWCGKDHCLLKIKRNGELSKAKNSTCFWPIMVTVNGYEKYTTAKLWNKEHAQIEIVEGIDKATSPNISATSRSSATSGLSGTLGTLARIAAPSTTRSSTRRFMIPSWQDWRVWHDLHHRKAARFRLL